MEFSLDKCNGIGHAMMQVMYEIIFTGLTGPLNSSHNTGVEFVKDSPSLLI